MIQTVLTHIEDEFKRQVNDLLQDGFKLSSSSCNTYQYEDYPEQTYWTAILIKEGE